MKRLLFSLLIVLLAVAGVNARTYVLIAGVSRYQNENNNLAQTTVDAKRFKEVMETQTKDITILTSKYAGHDNVLEKLSAICHRAGKDDKIIFYFSGHGFPGGIAAYDRPIAYDEINNLLSRSPASKICFIDACHAGTMGSSRETAREANLKAIDNQMLFLACRPEEVSKEDLFVGAGYFTQALIKGMRGKADKDANKQITALELFKYIYADVLKRSGNKQHPQLVAPKSMYDTVITRW